MNYLPSQLLLELAVLLKRRQEDTGPRQKNSTSKLARLGLEALAVSEIWAFTDKSVGREEGYRSRGASCGWKLRALLVTATVGSTLMALPTAPPEKGSRSPSTLMRRLNEAAETI